MKYLKLIPLLTSLVFIACGGDDIVTSDTDTHLSDSGIYLDSKQDFVDEAAADTLSSDTLLSSDSTFYIKSNTKFHTYNVKLARTSPPPGSGIDYHGGPVMTDSINIYLIWYGDHTGDSTQEIVTDFITDLSGSSWYEINTTYYELASGIVGDVGGPSGMVNLSNSINLVKSINDNYSRGKKLLTGDIQAIIADAIASNNLPLDSNGIYFILTSSDVKQTLGFSAFCVDFCGWHEHFSISDVDIKYSFVGNPKLCPSSCIPDANELQSPNSNIGADSMVSIIAHELAEAASDPDINAWYGNISYMENADMCAWKFGRTYTTANGSQANMKLGKRDFLIQQNWVNSVEGGYCATEMKY